MYRLQTEVKKCCHGNVEMLVRRPVVNNFSARIIASSSSNNKEMYRSGRIIKSEMFIRRRHGYTQGCTSQMYECLTPACMTNITHEAQHQLAGNGLYLMDAYYDVS